MQPNVAGADQRGLKNVERDPTGKGSAVNPEEERRGNGRMEEMPVDGAAESPNDQHRGQQRHREIEISIYKVIPSGDARDGTGQDILRQRSHREDTSMSGVERTLRAADLFRVAARSSCRGVLGSPLMH
jgi:hypothetical protein